MTNVTLTDTEWTRIRAFLKDDPNAYIGTDEAACRRFVEAVKWMSRSGAAWRLYVRFKEIGKGKSGRRS
jgi:transposase